MKQSSSVLFVLPDKRQSAILKINTDRKDDQRAFRYANKIRVRIVQLGLNEPEHVQIIRRGWGVQPEMPSEIVASHVSPTVE